MSKLVLTRCGGQGVEFKDDETGKASGITVLRVTGGDAKMHFDSCEAFVLRIGQSVPHPFLDLEVQLVGIQRKHAKLIFDAPKNVKIVRTELLKVPA